MRMPLRRFLKLRFPADRELDFSDGNNSLFRAAVRDDGSRPAMVEIQNPVIHAAKSYSKLVNAIAQVVRFGTPKFVAQTP
jgi:hypothetical protein